MASSISSNSDIINTVVNQPNKDNAIIITSMEQKVISPQAQLIHQVSGKHQMLPFVYIHAPTKVTNNKTNTMPMPPLQIQNLSNTNISQNTNSPSLLLSKQPLVLTKPATVTQKNGITYLLKSVNKPAETNLITTNRVPISAISTFKTDLTTISPISNSISKYVIAPMPKVTSNRLPITATTNSVQPKLSFMPITVPTGSNNKIINLKLSDGQYQETPPALTVVNNTNNMDVMGEKLLCDEKIDPDSPEKNIEDRSYQISIVEDSHSNSENGYTISIDDSKEKFHLKEPPKFTKQGVSILKKTYSFLDDIPTERPIISEDDTKTITAVSDANTKEVKITTLPKEVKTVSPSKEVNEVKAAKEKTPPKVLPQKKNERRRKSTICLRKYDEFETEEIFETPAKIPKIEPPVIIKPKIKIPVEKKVVKKEKAKVAIVPEEEEEEEELIVESVFKAQFAFGNDSQINNVLKWADGIATISGSNDTNFYINEFGFLEYLTKDDYKKVINKKKTAKRKEMEKKKLESQEEMRCFHCGCYGMGSEFISPKYCSLDCKKAGEKEIILQARKLESKKKRKLEESEDDNGIENTSNENSNERFNIYPWNCRKKGFSWAKYLKHMQAESAPVKLFKDPFPYGKNGFRNGYKLEGVDPQHPSYFCVLTVAEVLGYRIRLHFDGYPDSYDFWINADSMDIFPPGFCEKYGHTLVPPPQHKDDFNWNTYIKLTKSTPAPKHLFSNRNGNAIYPNGFRTGMKLEAVDKKNTSLVCVATITDMIDNRVLVHFDGWDDIYDYWADPTSPFIHPVGWCDKNGHKLTPPSDYPDPKSFTWEKYLKEKKAQAAPVRAFKQRPPSGFKKGMRLECVDRRIPHLIRVATVEDVRDHRLRIKFDGWPDKYDYWVDDDSKDIHPVGWCNKTRHPIEPPLTPNDVYEFLECATVGCRGLGHIKGPTFRVHYSQKECPYTDENLDLEKKLPDRLLPVENQPKAIVPISRDPIEKLPKISRPTSKLSPMKMEIKAEPERVQDEIKVFKPIACVEEEVNPEEVKSHEKHSRYLEKYIKFDKEPCLWSISDVAQFIRTVPNCRNESILFVKNKIDGMSFLMLTQQDLVEILRFKLGPAITLYNCIILLRKKIMNFR